MPIFVGSNSDDSRIRSNRVGFAVSTANPGSASEGDVYFNSSDSGLRAYDGSAWSAVGAGGGTVELVASGTLSNGQTVIIQNDGTVTGIATTSQSLGSPVVFESASLHYSAATFDSSNNKVVISYGDIGNSFYGTAVVGTVTGTGITFGTPVVFETGNTEYSSAVYDSANGKVVIAYRDGGNSDYGTAVVGTVSGDTISFGTPVIFESAASRWVSAAYDSTNGKVVIAYRDEGNSNHGTAIVGTVSGTSISFGSAVVFKTTDTRECSVVYDSSNEKIVIAYSDYGSSQYGKAIVGTVSGTSISFGSNTVFESARSEFISATYDSSNEKVVIAYQDGGNSDAGTAVVGTVSGTSISFGTPVVFGSTDDYEPEVVYDSNAGKVVIPYKDSGNSNYGTLVVGTVSGTSISFGSAVIFESAATDTISSTFDSTNNKVVIAYRDEGVTPKAGTSIVFRNESTTLTSENFIGFSDAAYSDGATATIQIAGAVDDAQSGLTTGSLHYVQNDGTLSTSAGSPSVEAGTALSATKIKVKK